MIGYIYKFKNKVNGKIYIGKTKNIKNRIRQHINVTSTKSTKFGNALRKYGVNNFDIEILIKIKSKDNTALDLILNTLEKYYIKKYDSFTSGYNLTIGGDGTINFKHSEETIQKFKNKALSLETRKKIGDSQRGKPSNRALTDTWRKSVVIARSTAVHQYSKDGVFIKTWDSITEASRFYHISKSCICRCCRQERKTCKGYIWKYC